MNRALLCLVLFTAIVSLHSADLDAGEKKKGPAATDKKVEEARRGTWRPRERKVGWGANKRGGAMRIKDGDRKKPARDRPVWAKWRKARGARRTYRNSFDEEYHARIFEETEAMVAENQAAFATGEASYELGINEFADYSEEEIAKLGIGEAGMKAALEEFSNIDDSSVFHTASSRVKRSPPSIDWRAEGKVGPVKNQGSCGSCYAFSAVGAIESRVAIKYNFNVMPLSEQQAVDCMGDKGGCDGGWMADVFKYVNESTQGLVREEEFPYKGQENGCPILPRGFSWSRIASHVKITPGDEWALQDAVGTTGPVSIAMNFGLADVVYYQRGIYNNDVPCPSKANHALVIVGYGTENGLDYWIVRNSWGASWGEQGYMRIRRGVNKCGIADWATYPVIA